MYSFLQARHFLVSINPALRNQKRVVKEKEKTLEKFSFTYCIWVTALFSAIFTNAYNPLRT
ncbi:MAG: hypothetical protein WCE25_07820 [Nitrososphaeraceae archaeon]